MSLGRILLLLTLAPAAAHAQLPPERPSADSDVLQAGLPFTMRVAPGLTPLGGLMAGAPSSVFTADYWSRTDAERAKLESRYGVHFALEALLPPTLVQKPPVPGHPQFDFVHELRFGGRALAGLQFERRNLLLDGDRLSIRATSDLQTLFGGAGLSGSQTAVDVLSLLGWRSHSRLVWQLGEPKHEIQWQFSAACDRRATTQNSRVDLQVLRHF